MSILTLNSVCYQYAGTEKMVLQGINAEFEKGKLYGIMGKSGAGKSTVLAIISGLDIPTDGTICYNGRNMNGIDRYEYRAQNIGVVFQSYNLLINATALENIILSMCISGNKAKDKKSEAYTLLEKLGIEPETANRKILKLSGGEQQRVGIARALAHNPDIIIADEPTGNLDGETEENIMNILSSLAHDEGKCVIVVTHSKNVSSYADELWGLNAGQMSFVK